MNESSDNKARGASAPPGGLAGLWLYWTLGGLSAVLLFGMMALTFFDVIGRYF